LNRLAGGLVFGPVEVLTFLRMSSTRNDAKTFEVSVHASSPLRIAGGDNALLSNTSRGSRLGARRKEGGRIS